MDGQENRQVVPDGGGNAAAGESKAGAGGAAHSDAPCAGDRALVAGSRSAGVGASGEDACDGGVVDGAGDADRDRASGTCGADGGLGASGMGSALGASGMGSALGASGMGSALDASGSSEGADERLAAAGERLLAACVREAAPGAGLTGRGAAAALRLCDFSACVGGDGLPDEAAVAGALAAFLNEWPEFAQVPPPPPFAVGTGSVGVYEDAFRQRLGL